LGEPRAGHHHSAAGDQPEIDQVGEGGQRSLAHTNVIGMDDNDAIRVPETEFAQYGIGLHRFAPLSPDRVVLPL
jgi:hypothetical protein